MKIADVAEASGLPAKTIRYYEDIGPHPAGAGRERLSRRSPSADVHKLTVSRPRPFPRLLHQGLPHTALALRGPQPRQRRCQGIGRGPSAPRSTARSPSSKGCVARSGDPGDAMPRRREAGMPDPRRSRRPSASSRARRMKGPGRIRSPLGAVAAAAAVVGVVVAWVAVVRRSDHPSSRRMSRLRVTIHSAAVTAEADGRTGAVRGELHDLPRPHMQPARTRGRRWCTGSTSRTTTATCRSSSPCGNGVRAHHWQFGNMPPVEGRLGRGRNQDHPATCASCRRANGIL